MYHPITIGSLSLPGNLFLAPVAGYTDRAYRAICVEQGADFTFTELASAEALTRGGAGAEKTRLLVRRAEGEARYAIQLFGPDPDLMYRAALLLAPFRPDAVDINAGCPVPKVVKSGAGSGLMRDPARLGKVVEAVVKASREALDGVPVTIKMRLGWDAASVNYRDCARIAVEAGAAMVTLHARTRAQGYEGRADWTAIADLVTRCPVPVCASGDLYRPEDAGACLDETGCAALMFARGAIGNPFIFGMTRQYLRDPAGGYAPPPWKERFALAFRQLSLRAADIGEAAACREMRKAFCAYTKGVCGTPGLPEGAKLRERLVRAESEADYREILGEWGD
jgi:nifR3 family TIM-barrel protein